MPILTRAAVIESPGAAFAVHDVELDEPRADEVLVRVVAAGLCHTDLGVQAGGIPFKLPGILGHEGAGIVEQVGSAVTRVVPGDKVLLSFTSCGRCGACRGGHPAYCAAWLPSNLITGVRGDGSATVTRNGSAIGGHFFGQSSFAQYSLADERTVIKVDPDADLAVLAPLGCGVQTGFGSVWNILRPEAGTSIAIFGSGAVGLAAIMAARLMPLSAIIAVDRVPERLELARELGATHTIDATGMQAEDINRALLEATSGRGIDNAVETTAVPGVLRSAVDALAARGACAVVGAPPAGTEVALDVQGLLTGKRVIGVTLGDADPETLIPHMVALHRAGKLPLERLIRHYELDEISQAAADMHAGRTIKPVIKFS